MVELIFKDDDLIFQPLMDFFYY